jgi:hypothetical protein
VPTPTPVPVRRSTACATYADAEDAVGGGFVELGVDVRAGEFGLQDRVVDEAADGIDGDGEGCVVHPASLPVRRAA